MEPGYKPLHPLEEIQRHGRRLPHWQQEGSTFFLTFRLADSIPRERIDRLDIERAAWLAAHPPPWSDEQEREYHERFSVLVDRWLDELHGECLLRQPELRAPLEDVLRRYDGERVVLHAFVIMPNHVHGLVTLGPAERLERLVQAWKGAGARAINRARGGEGSLWQKDYFDRLIRDGRHFWRCARYIRRNPGKAKLRLGEYTLYEQDAVREVLDAESG